MLLWNWETAYNLERNLMRSCIIFLKRNIFLKIFTKRQLILLAILLPVLHCYFFIQSECLYSEKSEMCFNLHLLIAHFSLFAVTSEVLLSSASWGTDCDRICSQSFWENWILLQKLSGFSFSLEDACAVEHESYSWKYPLGFLSSCN